MLDKSVITIKVNITDTNGLHLGTRSGGDTTLLKLNAKTSSFSTHCLHQ